MFTAEEVATMQRWMRSADECREAAAEDRRLGLVESAAVYDALAVEYEGLIEDFGRTVAQALVAARPEMVA